MSCIQSTFIVRSILSTFAIKVDCIHDVSSDADSCTVIVRSNEDPDNVKVGVKPRVSDGPLIFDIQFGTNYTITVYTVNNGDVQNSTVHTMEVYTGTSVCDFIVVV